MFNKKTPTIKFISMQEGLSQVEDCVPKPSYKLIPEWWKKMPMIKTNISFDGVDAGSVKNCPSFPDYFSNGYIMPMWTDTILFFDSSRQEWKARQSDPEAMLSVHPPYQYTEHVNHKFMGRDTFAVFKLVSPWQIFTDKGYSIYQLPTFYHFNEDFSVLPGIIDTDTYCQTNIQLLIHSDKKEIFIPRGTPLAQYVVFKRNKLNGIVRDANNEDKKNVRNIEKTFLTKFGGSKEYQNIRKKRDKKEND